MAILIFGMAIYVQVIETAVTQGESLSPSFIHTAIQTTPLEKVTKTESYHGSQSLILLYGIGRGGEEMVVFMDEAGKVLHYDWPKKAFPPEKIDQWVEARYPGSAKIHLVPGMERGIYLWEGLYKTKEGHFLYVYFRFNDGAFLRSIALSV